MKRLVIFLSVLLLVCSSPLWAVTLTVSTVGGTGDFNSIQLAINSCLSNPDVDDVINILDNGPYYGALEIQDGTQQNITLQALAGIRPVIVADSTSAITQGVITNSGIAVDVDGGITIRDIVLIPSITEPPNDALTVDEFTGSGAVVGYNATLINVLISGNNGSDQPLSYDGFTYVYGSQPFLDDGLDLGSTPTTSQVYLEKVIVTGATAGSTGDGIRVFTDGNATNRGQATIGEGCVSSFNAANGILCGGMTATDLILNGSSSSPIILYSNNIAGIYHNGSTNGGITQMNWVISLGNFGTSTSYGFRDDDTSPLSLQMSNCTFVSNTGSCIYIAASPITAQNVIFAGNGSTNTNNLIILGTGSLTINDSNIVIQDESSLFDIALNASFDSDGVSGTLIPTNIINRDPDFASLTPGTANFVAVQNTSFATAGISGQPLTGGGSYIGGGVPVELSSFQVE